MKFPVCPDVTLTMTERQSIEIDYCPQCRGVWLDRGELDKIIERSAGDTHPAPQAQPYQAPPPAMQPYGSHGQQHRQHDYHERKHSHHKSFWKELFD
jgi:hypothetical protein